MLAAELVHGKIHEIILELKLQHLWQKKLPEWVTDFGSREIMSEEDFAEWLQFVYLPNLMQYDNRNVVAAEKYIVPQAMKFFGVDLRKGKLLQLLIELDALT